VLKESRDISSSYLFNSRLSPAEFLQYILIDFGLPECGKNKGELLLSLGQFLVSRGAGRFTSVLIVDEAHLLSEDLLEEIRLLSNLETADDKLLQILLAGQPELEQKLDSPGLRQLKQRIALRAHLEPLDYDEAKEYVAKRLLIAGASAISSPIFPAETVAAVFRYSRGLPRLINTICENGLIAAYARKLATVTPGIIDEVAREFRLNMDLAESDESTRERTDLDIRPPANARPGIFANLREPAADGSGFDEALVSQASKYEPIF
jgi:general secretion pathway protein A